MSLFDFGNSIYPGIGVAFYFTFQKSGNCCGSKFHETILLMF